MDPNDPNAALMFRKAQLQAQEQMAMNGQPQTAAPQQLPPQMQPTMPQAGFSGYGMQRPQMNPQQLQQLAALLQRRSQ